MKLSDIHIRDPFILPHNGKYYLYGSTGAYAWSGQDGFSCYISEDLINWTGPVKCFDRSYPTRNLITWEQQPQNSKAPATFWADDNYWAPEVHYYNGAFYMFASFGSAGHPRCSQILRADQPEGPFEVWSFPITPAHQYCIDATLHIENGVPYAIYCHETIDIESKDGEMVYVEITEDLKKPVGEHKIMFTASEPGWTAYKKSLKEKPICVTDGPLTYRAKDGKLLMIWSSHYGPGQYIEAVSYSENGSIHGPWKHCDNLLFKDNGGHGMIFKTFEGELMFILHTPNSPHPNERPRLYKLAEIDEDPYLKIIGDPIE